MCVRLGTKQQLLLCLISLFLLVPSVLSRRKKQLSLAESSLRLHPGFAGIFLPPLLPNPLSAVANALLVLVL